MSNILQNTGHIEINDGQCCLIAANDHTQKWFDEKKTGNLPDDLLLAKSMGLILSKNPDDFIEKIASSEKNKFWCDSAEKFIKTIADTEGKICVILNFSSTSYQWLENFVITYRRYAKNPRDIKICYRESNREFSELNQWIKKDHLGGSVKDGRVLVFLNTPGKWIFKENIDFSMIVVRSEYYPSNTVINNWHDSHPCTVILGHEKPKFFHESGIVKL